MTALASEPRPPSRSPELQDPLNRWLYHPLSARLARLLLPTGLSPNVVSIAGAATVWAAAWAYVALAWPIGAWIGFSLHLLWHVIDGADGDLARLRGGGSPSGELIDGLCDYAGHAVLYVALAAMLAQSIGAWTWALALAAGASHILQTNHAESQRRAYLWWVYGIPWLKHARAADDALFEGRGWFGRSVGWLARSYLDGANALTPHIARVDRLFERAEPDPARTAVMRTEVRRRSRGSLQWQKLLGPNPRAIMLGVSMIGTASPLGFFLAETLLLNLLLAASVIHHQRLGAQLENRLSLLDYEENGGRGKD